MGLTPPPPLLNNVKKTELLVEGGFPKMTVVVNSTKGTHHPASQLNPSVTLLMSRAPLN